MSASPQRIAVSDIARGRPVGPAARFWILGAGAVALSVAGGIALGVPLVPVGVASTALAVAVAIVVPFLRRDHPHRRLGAANVITLVRLTIVAMLFAMLLTFDPEPEMVIPLAVVALGLDGVDGYLARRQGLASRFGAAFDVEVDSAFGLILSLLAAFGPAGPIAIVLGLPRYLFGAATLVFPWLNAPLAPRFSRKAVCVAQLVALIVLQIPGLPVGWALSIVAVTTALLVWSFSIDIVAAFRARRQRGAVA